MSPGLRRVARSRSCAGWRGRSRGSSTASIASDSVPGEGAVLLLPNHPNALLDPAIVWATAGRDVRFLAKSTLFEGAFAPVLVAGAAQFPCIAGSIRASTRPSNAETFAAVDARSPRATRSASSRRASAIRPAGSSRCDGGGAHGARGRAAGRRRHARRGGLELRTKDGVPLARHRAVRQVVLDRRPRGRRRRAGGGTRDYRADCVADAAVARRDGSGARRRTRAARRAPLRRRARQAGQRRGASRAPSEIADGIERLRDQDRRGTRRSRCG